MGILAATIVVTHPFEVVILTKVVAVICLRNAYDDIGCYIDGTPDVETLGHLEVGGWPRVLLLGGSLGILAVPLCGGCGWSGRGVEV